MMMPDCPRVVPSLDDPAGWYCTAECGGNCHTGAVLPSTAKNAYLPRVSAGSAPQLRASAASATGEQLSHDDLPILAALMQPPSAIEGDTFTPGQVVWKECTYYGVTGWHPFTIVDQEYATCRTSIIVEGQAKEVCDTIIMNQGFKARVRDQPPKPATGATITYQGRAMVVYHPGTSDDRLWLMESGGTVANVYQWPPMAAAPEGTLENHSDSLEIGGFSDSDHVWSECGPYKSHDKTYYRYRWGRGRKIEGVRHIPGGALTNSVVANRAYRVHQAVRVEGRSHTEVLAMIDGWRTTPRK